MPEQKKHQQNIQSWVIIALLFMTAYQLYNGFYFKKVGIPGIFEIELGQADHSTQQINLLGKTVYIQISSESQRNDADSFRRTLTDNSAKVYGITNPVKEGTVPPDNANHSFPEGYIQIRYFYPSDKDAASAIKKLLQHNNVLLDANTEDTKKNPEGVLEVWYPWSTK